MKGQLILGLSALVFILFSVDDVFAHSGHDDESEFNFGHWWQDASANFVGLFSSDAKTALITEHLAQAQAKSENGISDAIESHDNDIRIAKKIKELDDGVKPSVTQLVTEVALSGELTQINDLHNDFLDYRSTWFNDFQMPDYNKLKDFESSINNLDLAEKYCQNIIATTLIQASQPYTDYIQNQCPALEDISPDLVMSVFDGVESEE
jgi:hypothetical protein